MLRKDPATAFEKSWKLFHDSRKKGDLEGMMEVIRARGVGVGQGLRPCHVAYPRGCAFRRADVADTRRGRSLRPTPGYG